MIKLSTKTKPWAHQAQELELWDCEARALLWQMRTGKSKVIVDTLGAWLLYKGLQSAIIIAPNGVHVNWVRCEIPTHADYPYRAIAWHSSKPNDTLGSVLEAPGLAILVIGKEAILTPRGKKTINLFLKRGPCALIVDESHHFGHAGSKRTRVIRGLALKCCMRRILTGTPMGNSPMRTFSQFEILQKEALGYRTYAEFERRYGVMGKGYNHRTNREFTQIVGYKHLIELQERVAQYSSVVLREDCEDLPPLIQTRHYYQPSKAQMIAYENLRLNLIAELDTGSKIEALDAGVLLMRLQQILSNFCTTDEFGLETIDPKNDPRLDALMDIIDGPTIVWCRFREDIRRVVERLKGNCVEYHGRVNQTDRQKALDDFLGGEVDVFVGQPACAGEGLNLSRAKTIVWYSHVFDVVARDQASERATIVGGGSVAIVDIAAPNTIDEYILDNLDKKHKIADKLTGHALRDLLKGIGV